MNILIIEDEAQTAWDLKQTLQRLRPEFTIIGVIDSVETGKEWFSKNTQPDMIFSDIRLGDGLAFDIFEEFSIKAPIVFCTAYDEYLLQAFKSNGIDYILKPINEHEVDASLKKLHTLREYLSTNDQAAVFKAAKALLNNDYRKSFLVSYRQKLIPVETANIELFRINANTTELHTNDGSMYSIPYTLEQLETCLDPKNFYRANRQIIIAYKAITEIEHYHERKLLVHLRKF
ncbi:MAG TPA: LytTR family DNA-binding domain-containing protein, partial [Chitinophagaceae bacterium]